METKYLTWIWGKLKVWTKKKLQKKLLCVSGCIAFCAKSFALSTYAFRTSGKYHDNSGRTISMMSKKDHLIISFRHLKLPSAVLKMFFNGKQAWQKVAAGRKISTRSQNFGSTPRTSLVFQGFALGWSRSGQKSRRGTVQRLNTLTSA